MSRFENEAFFAQGAYEITPEPRELIVEWANFFDQPDSAETEDQAQQRIERRAREIYVKNWPDHPDLVEGARIWTGLSWCAARDMQTQAAVARPKDAKSE